jgi:hypothetical protein
MRGPTASLRIHRRRVLRDERSGYNGERGDNDNDSRGIRREQEKVDMRERSLRRRDTIREEENTSL